MQYELNYKRSKCHLHQNLLIMMIFQGWLSWQTETMGLVQKTLEKLFLLSLFEMFLQKINMGFRKHTQIFASVNIPGVTPDQCHKRHADFWIMCKLKSFITFCQHNEMNCVFPTRLLSQTPAKMKTNSKENKTKTKTKLKQVNPLLKLTKTKLKSKSET